MKTKLPVLLFDAECSLCVRFTQGLKLIDKNNHINMVEIQNHEIYEEFPELTFEDCSETIHLINAENEILKGGDVIKFLVKEIPAVSKFAWLLEPESASKAMDVFYSKVNEVRKQIKKSKGCNNCGKRRSHKENSK